MRRISKLVLSARDFVFLAGLSVAIPALSFLAVVVMTYSEAEISRMKRDGVEQSQQLSEVLNADLSKGKNLVSVLGKTISRIGTDRFVDTAKDFLSQYTDDIFLLVDDRVSASTRVSRDLDGHDSRLARDANRLNRPVVSGIIKRDDGFVINIVAPVQCDTRCSVHAAIPIKHFSDIIDKNNSDEWAASLLDADLRFIFRQGSPELTGSATRNMVADVIRKAASGQHDLVNVFGVSVRYFFKRVEESNWVVGVSIPQDAYLAPLRNNFALLLSAGIILIGVMIGGTLYFGMKLRRAIVSMKDATNDIEAFGRSPVSEINYVADHLRKATLDLKCRNEELEVAAKQAHVLMRETLHRSKNQLAIVRSLTKLSSKYAKTPKEMEARLSARMEGLSQTQNIMVAREWKGATLDELILAQIDNHTRVDLIGPSILILPEPAHNLGVVFGELFDNATRHGSLSNDRGRVKVSWSMREDDLVIVWEESGGPPVAEPTYEGFGHIALKRIAESSMNGETRFEYRPEGFRWELVCPSDSYVFSLDNF